MRFDLAASVVVVLLAPAIATADETTRVSNSPTGAAGNGASSDPALSADGNLVAFVSEADDLVAGDTNGVADVFLFDRAAATLTRVSVATSGAQANGVCQAPALSADGRFVAFASDATNLDADPNGAKSDVFLRDLVAGTTRLLSIDPQGLGANGLSWYPSISRDGRRVTFQSTASNLVANDANGFMDVFVWDAATGIALVSGDPAGVAGDGLSRSPILSGDGEVVAFFSWSQTFPNPPPVGAPALYAKVLATGAIDRLDVDSAEHGDDDVDAELNPASGISDDGNFVVFNTASELEDDDENEAQDVYLRDRAAGTTERVDVGWEGEPAERGSSSGKLSGDGRFVAFYSDSRELTRGDSNRVTDVYLRDRLHGVTTRVSVGSADEQGSDRSFTTPSAGNALSADGSVLVFQSFATEFAPADGNAEFDVFVRERCDLPAAWSRYGAGFANQSGVLPVMTPRTPPWRGALLTIDVASSAPAASVGVVLVGPERASLPTLFGGTLLVDPLLVLPIVLPPGGGLLALHLPDAAWSCGGVANLQTIELDPSALRGLTFSAGLELVFGE